MSNPAISELIARQLPLGLPVAGEDDKVVPVLPAGFRAAGMPPQQAEHINTTLKLMADGVVALIEGEGASTIVPNDELAELKRLAEANGQEMVYLYCVHCKKPWAAVSAAGVDVAMFVQAVKVQCPHGAQ